MEGKSLGWAAGQTDREEKNSTGLQDRDGVRKNSDGSRTE